MKNFYRATVTIQRTPSDPITTHIIIIVATGGIDAQMQLNTLCDGNSCVVYSVTGLRLVKQ